MLTAIIPAAGLSTRMGGSVPKPLLPWAAHTVIEQVVATLLDAGIADLVVVTGREHQAVERVLASYPLRCVGNPAYSNGEMLASIQVGLAAAAPGSVGALLALADQPQMQLDVVRRVLTAFQESAGQALVIPSYAMRQGHPIALPRWLWPEVMALTEGGTLRDLIRRHSAAIHYVAVDTPSVLADLDTPDQYAAQRPVTGPQN